jgi:hypothetical protein
MVRGAVTGGPPGAVLFFADNNNAIFRPVNLNQKFSYEKFRSGKYPFFKYKSHNYRMLNITFFGKGTRLTTGRGGEKASRHTECGGFFGRPSRRRDEDRAAGTTPAAPSRRAGAGRAGASVPVIGRPVGTPHHAIGGSGLGGGGSTPPPGEMAWPAAGVACKWVGAAEWGISPAATGPGRNLKSEIDVMAEQQKKSRAERHEELRRLWMTAAGRDHVLDLFLEATGLPPGTMPGAGTLIFQTILDKEYLN